MELRLELCAGDKLTPGTGPRRAVDTAPWRMPPWETSVSESPPSPGPSFPSTPWGKGYTALVGASTVSEQHPQAQEDLASCLCCVVLGSPCSSLSLRALLVKWSSSWSVLRVVR